MPCASIIHTVNSSSFMFAIVTIAGFQEKAEKGAKLKVQRLEAKEGDTLTFDKVHLVADGDNVIVGKPLVAGASVKAKVLMHGLDDKIVVRKFKRRKRFHKTYRGHRQQYTVVEVVSVGK